MTLDANLKPLNLDQEVGLDVQLSNLAGLDSLHPLMAGFCTWAFERLCLLFNGP